MHLNHHQWSPDYLKIITQGAMAASEFYAVHPGKFYARTHKAFSVPPQPTVSFHTCNTH
jgi:hypothetical protein